MQSRDICQRDAGTIAVLTLPHALKLKNRLPASCKTVDLLPSPSVPQTYTAFSAFLTKDPNVLPLYWDLLVQQSDRGLAVAVDQFTGAIVGGSAVVSITPSEINLQTDETTMFYCMYCGVPLTDPLFCEGCGFVAYCGQPCADAGWEIHKHVCARVREGLEKIDIWPDQYGKK